MIVLEGELGGRYVLGPRLAVGGQGVIYEAVDSLDGRRVAIKVALSPGSVGQAARLGAMRMAMLAEDPVVGPCLVPVWDIGQWDDRLFVVLERLEATLEAWLAAGGSAEFALRGLLRAMDALDRSGVAHGDLKPSNVFVRDEEGHAVLLGDLWPGAGEPGISPGYAAPEVWRGAPPDVVADRYALGATVVAMWTGAPPPCAMAGADARLPTPPELAALPPDVARIAARLLDPARDRRVSAAEALAMLDGAEAPARRRPGARLLAAATLLGVAGAAGLASLWPRPLDAPPCPPPFVGVGATCEAPDGRRVALVRAGTYVAGDTLGLDPLLAVDAVPVEITLTRDVWFRTTEVTQAEFTHLLDENPNETVWEFLPEAECSPCSTWLGIDLLEPAHPASCFTWWDALTLANAASAADGLEPAYEVTRLPSGERLARWDQDADGWRLPTEAEWEWAARGGAAGQRWAGAADRDTICTHANVRDRAAPEHWGNEVPCDDGAPVLAPVGSYAPNALGLHDMLGNVNEWIWDRYEDRLPGSATDPIGPAFGPFHVARGGGWNQIARPTVARYATNGDGHGLNEGMRLVRTAIPRSDP